MSKINAVDVATLDAGFLETETFSKHMAGPMSRFPAFAESRNRWLWPAEKVAVRVRTAGGAEGISVTSGGSIVADIVAQHLTRFVVDRTVADIETIWDMMFRSLLPYDRSGFAMMAISAVDIALWDLRSRLEQRSLADLVGDGQATDRPPAAYVTTPSPDDFATTAFAGIKVPMPCGPEDGEDGIGRNVAAVAAARRAAGADRDVMIDAYMGWSGEYTLRMLDALQHLDVRWFEDPLPACDVDGYAKLKSAAGDGLRLALGNFCFNRWEIRQILDACEVAYLQPDVAWAGGITECLRIAAIAEEGGIPVILHNTSEQPWALELSVALPAITEVEHVDRGHGSLLAEIFENGSRLADGVVVPSDGGSQLRFTERARSAMTPVGG